MKKILLKINKRRLILILLLPFVIAGSIYVYQNKQANAAVACDLITITYNGQHTPKPIFSISDFKPGDVEKKCFVVKNVNTTKSFDVLMKGEMTQEEKQLADVLEIIIGNGIDIYGGTTGFKTVQNFLDESSSINLGNFSPISEKTFCITVKFPPESGNEYQLAKVVFNIIWNAEIVEDNIPPECREMTFERVIEGTEGNDNIHGSTKSELILAKGGNDKIRASSGNDCIVGGDGNDKIYSESGNDIILGGAGNDHIDSGSGNDTVYGGDGNDKIKTGSGDDLIYAGSGNDNIDSGAGKDKLYGENGNDTLRGGSGNDELYGGAGNDNLHGGSGDDILDGGLDTDTLHGDVGHDTCTTGESLHSCEI